MKHRDNFALCESYPINPGAGNRLCSDVNLVEKFIVLQLVLSRNLQRYSFSLFASLIVLSNFERYSSL